MSAPRGIIVEGCDCSGKSTLVKALKSALSTAGWDVLDMGHKPTDQFKRYAQTYLGASNLLLDRGHFSEVVYGDMWRGGRHFELWERSVLDDLVRNHFVVVLCTAPPEVLAQRYAARLYGQVIRQDELRAVQERFIHLLGSVDILRYESTNQAALDAIVESVLGRIRTDRSEGDVLRSPSSEASPRARQFILLEGANGSGKSTMAKLLKVHLVGWHVKTLDFNPDRQPYERFLDDYLSGHHAIFDRGHFSEIVYGDMFRQGHHFGENQAAFLAECVSHRGVVILCEASESELRERIAGAPYPKHIHPDRLREVKARFREVLGSSGVPYRVVQTNDAKEVASVVSQVSSELGGMPYHVMGWDMGPQEKRMP